jgi:hypothetical protein
VQVKGQLGGSKAFGGVCLVSQRVGNPLPKFFLEALFASSSAAGPQPSRIAFLLSAPDTSLTVKLQPDEFVWDAAIVPSPNRRPHPALAGRVNLKGRQRRMF